MKVYYIALLLSLLALAACGYEHQPRPSNVTFVRRSGTLNKCLNGVSHQVKYDTFGFDDDNIFDMDQFPALKSISCDLDSSKLHIIFHDEIHSTEIAAKLAGSNKFVVGGAKFGCQVKNQTANVLRRVIQLQLAGANIYAQTSKARYDEIYEEADIEYASGGSCESSVQDKRVCLGFNTDCEHGATIPLPLYQNRFVDVTCSECYHGWSGDIFLKIKIKEFTVQYIGVGYKNAFVNSSFVLDITSQPSWSVGINKVAEFVPPTPIIDFTLGIVPFIIIFEIPVAFNADLALQLDAEVTVGAQSNTTVGDHYIEFTPDDGWVHKKPAPVTVTSSELTAHASFEADATFSIVPTFTMHVDRILTYRVTFTPELDATVTGDTTSKEVCDSATYDLTLTSEVEVDINIPWANINDDWIWGPDVVWTSGTQNITQKCITVG